MNRKEFSLLVEGWKSFLNEESQEELPGVYQGPDPFQALGGGVGGRKGPDVAENLIIGMLHEEDYDEGVLKKDSVQEEIINICKSCGVLGSCDTIVSSVLTTLNHNLENSNTSSYYNELLAPFMNLAGMPEKYIEKEEYDEGGMRIRKQEINPDYTEFMAKRGI